MHRVRRLPVLGMILALLWLTGCDVKTVRLLIPDFDTAQVEGAWFYRQSAETGLFEPETEVRFELPTYFEAGEERIDYTTTNPNAADLNLTARVEREGDGIAVRLVWGAKGGPTSYRAATYNAAGESPLSDGVVL